MAQKKSHEVDRWLARPDPAVRVVLVYGPDQGLVSERARAFARATGLPLDDPFSVVRLDGSTVAADPGRLMDEAMTVAMFAPRRLIWVLNAGADKALADTVASLSANPPPDSFVLIEAGDLKKGAALRAAAEDGAAAMALPCYPDDAKAVDALIEEVLGGAGLRLELEARDLLKTVLGADRRASRGELEKLALYCAGMSVVGVEDVRAGIGDVGSSGIDDAVFAALEGKGVELDRALARLEASGTQPFPVLAAAQRQLQALQLMRDQVDREGKSPSGAVASARPPVFFARKPAVEGALAALGSETLARLLERFREAVLETRRRPELAWASMHRAMLALALERARSRRAGR